MRKRERLAGSKAYRLRFEAEKSKPLFKLRHTESAADALSGVLADAVLPVDETEEEEIVTRQDGSMLVEASMNIDDFMEEMGILSYEDLESEDFTTLGGLAMFLIGRIPKAGDIFTYKNLQFEVVDMDRGRVDKLLVIKRDDEQE